MCVLHISAVSCQLIVCITYISSVLPADSVYYIYHIHIRISGPDREKIRILCYTPARVGQITMLLTSSRFPGSSSRLYHGRFYCLLSRALRSLPAFQTAWDKWYAGSWTSECPSSRSPVNTCLVQKWLVSQESPSVKMQIQVGPWWKQISNLIFYQLPLRYN